MKIHRCVALLVFLCVPFVAAQADEYPNKPIRIVVPYPPGGVADTISRQIGEGLSKELGQSVLIENKPGGKQIIGAEAVARAAPDGYTLFLGSLSALVLNPTGMSKLSYDVAKDFAPVTQLFLAPLLLVTNAQQVPAKNVAELLTWAKANPGKLSYGSVGQGSSNHLAGELFKSIVGIDAVHVPYKGSAPVIIDLVSGQVQFTFDAGTSSLPHVKSGKLNLLAVTTAKRFPYLPDVPTMIEAGVPGFAVTAWWGIVAPAGTPPAIVDRVAKAVEKVASSKELRDRYGKDGIAIETDSPAQFGAFIKAETKRWGEFFKTSGISLDN